MTFHISSTDKTLTNRDVMRIIFPYFEELNDNSGTVELHQDADHYVIASTDWLNALYNDSPKCSSCIHKNEDVICYGCVDNDEYEQNREDCLAYDIIDCEGRDCSKCSIFNEKEK